MKVVARAYVCDRHLHLHEACMEYNGLVHHCGQYKHHSMVQYTSISPKRLLAPGTTRSLVKLGGSRSVRNISLNSK